MTDYTKEPSKGLDEFILKSRAGAAEDLATDAINGIDQQRERAEKAIAKLKKIKDLWAIALANLEEATGDECGLGMAGIPYDDVQAISDVLEIER